MASSKEIVASVTQRGQVTIPVEVRRLLGAEAHSKVIFRVEGTEVRLLPAAYTVESAFRSVPPLPNGMSPDDAIRLAKTERVEQAVQELRES